jgi:hypothetical protein
MKNFVKPNLSLYFAGLPAIGIWMCSEYNNAKNYAQCVNVVHNWYNIAEETNNIVKKECYSKGASLLYQLLTGKTFESRKLI